MRSDLEAGVSAGEGVFSFCARLDSLERWSSVVGGHHCGVGECVHGRTLLDARYEGRIRRMCTGADKLGIQCRTQLRGATRDKGSTHQHPLCEKAVLSHLSF